MFSHTKKNIEKLLKQFKLLGLIFSILNFGFALSYPIFAILIDLGNFYINIAVLVTTILYGLMWLIFKDNKKYKINRIYTYLRILASFIALSLNIYNIYLAANNVNITAILLAAASALFLFLKTAVNVLYDVFVPKIKNFANGLKKDMQPLTLIGGLLHKKAKPTEEELKEIQYHEEKRLKKETKVLNSTLKEEAKTTSSEIIDKIDENEIGFINLEDFIKEGLKIDKVLIDKNKFLKDELGIDNSKISLSKFLKRDNKTNNLSPHELSDIANKIRNENNDNANLLKDCLDDQFLAYKSDKEFKKIYKSFLLTLISMQKIIYLYGFSQIECVEMMKEEQMSALILAFSIVLNLDNQSQAKFDLYKLRNNLMQNKIKDFTKDKIKFLASKNENIKELVKKNLPTVNEITNMFVSPKVAVPLNIVLKSIGNFENTDNKDKK